MSVNVSTGYATALLAGTAFADIFYNGVIEVRSGSQPATADGAVTGTLLGRITRNGGLFTPGSPANGLQFSQHGRMVSPVPAHQWILAGLAPGTAGWFRLLANAPDAGDFSLTHPRIDGRIGLADTPGDIQMRMSTAAITPESSIIVTQWIFGIPPIGE